MPSPTAGAGAGGAPGVGAGWGDPLAQARASEILALTAFSFGGIGLLGVVLGAIDEPRTDPTRNVAIAPIASAITAGVQLGGRF